MQTNQREPAQVRISIQLYRFLVRFYPSAFRHQYGELMIQVFRDSCRQANHQESITGLILLWVRTLVDTFLSLIEQFSNRGAMMTKSSWIKLSGWFMAAGSVLFLFSWFASSRPIYNEHNLASWPIDRFLNAAATPFMVMGVLFLAFGILGLRSRFASQAGSSGYAGLMISLLGSGAVLVGIIGLRFSENGPWWETTMIGVTILFLGLMLFGISCVRRKLFSRWNSLPLLASILWPLMTLIILFRKLIFNTDLVVPQAVIYVSLIVAFGGLGLIGYLLQSDTGNPHSEPV